MSNKKKKPAFMGPPTQEQALSRFPPKGFYAPYGRLEWGEGGYRAQLEPAYDRPDILEQYNVLRQRLLGDIGLIGPEREASLEQYGQAFLDKTLEYAAPRLRALTYGRGQAGSRMAADAYADLLSKATTQAILSREDLRRLDEQLKLQQLGTIEQGITADLARKIQSIQQLLAGGHLSEEAQKLAVEQMNNYIAQYNALEAERIQRARQAPSWLAPVTAFSSLIPGVGPAISAGLGIYGATQGYGINPFAFTPLIGQIGSWFSPSIPAGATSYGGGAWGMSTPYYLSPRWGGPGFMPSTAFRR